MVTATTCGGCGRGDVGDGRFCRWCGQFLVAPAGVHRASVARRIAALILDDILPIPTLLVGYLIWWLIVLKHGQTPGKQIMGIRAMRTNGQPADWGLTFLREFVVKGLVFGVVAAATVYIGLLIDYFWAVFDRDTQTLHDKIVETVVVQDTPVPTAGSTFASA